MALAAVIDGKAFAEKLRACVAVETERLRSKHQIEPGLAVVLVGSNSASRVYVKSKSKQARDVGIRAIDYHLDENVSESDLLTLIAALNTDRMVHGILVQLPLPKQISSDQVLRTIDPSKDVDGFHPINVGLLAAGQTSQAFVPCTPLGCVLLLKDRLGSLSGKSAVVIGRSNIVGKPMLQLLLNEDCTVTVAHSRTKHLEDHCRGADIVVAAVGKPGFVRGTWLKPGATVIDVGINRIPAADGTSRIVGDVDYHEARELAGSITPVPGGVGPMTIACLLANTVKAACLANGLAAPDWSAMTTK
jgi:methylenetetrahydrofolate dehydrogenase (NADP+) / methenyltetrahydrofolate cyclohydrolase